MTSGLHPLGGGTSSVIAGSPADVRWDTWEHGSSAVGASQLLHHHANASTSEGDELLYLLEVIHRKTVRLRKDVETNKVSEQIHL